MKVMTTITLKMEVEYDACQFTEAEIKSMIVAAFRVEDGITDDEFFLPEIKESDEGSGARIMEYLDFEVESHIPTDQQQHFLESPGPGTSGSYCIMLDDDELNLLREMPQFEEMLEHNRLDLLDNELWIYGNDQYLYMLLSKEGII